ncbi:hypothetical protein COCC4DRAFT_138175 [Bipolaris maydis ATCC 48331]|uniref:Uncharacterized protein n=2 Tax=Cochliobolus heterostrophus TaxID=5016 RepID=M2UM29_COCH5|nr:uncharacterized protein COCC4DRAFT_138175 [Bipolaris maydis ATCC 48331]EMD89008.1 hypothetical protein COCHEDRAFT_1226199 [Bipolaris maydis C5]KAH7552392.1 hypothetical protein BM1_08343 [Bipolaris maydis]ENI05273.1 hypothetical protein COCC4DRAFT_138175 [Bipolaris maydis ATCC 48331]KAJ5024691.1 hypothetical protein J3E73DRAFT_234964 [Bipolaris maydis]KAJ6212385.1 hypothetical protein PSV09DRAFT_1226199 [Bipolaris maydis]
MEAMLRTSSDNLITTLISYLVPDQQTPSETPSTNSSGYGESSSGFSRPLTGNIEKGKGYTKEGAPNSSLEAIPRGSLKRSASDLTALNGISRDQKTAVTALNAFRSKDGMYHPEHATASLSPTSLQPSPIAIQWPLSSSRNGLMTVAEEATKSSASSQSPLFERAEPVSKHSGRSQPYPRPATDGMLTRIRPLLTRSTAVRSNSDPDLAKTYLNPRSRDRHLPLKSCMKKRAKSDTITSLGGIQRKTEDHDSKDLCRIKTVDFEGSGSKPSSHVSSTVVIPKSLHQTSNHDAKTLSRPTNTRRRSISNSPSCPKIIGTTKSSAADPAITRTDVHVVAITPSWDTPDIVNEEGSDPATPTMQVIETKTSSYEVIWDDVPLEQRVRGRGRRSSSASHSLEMASPSARRGLERVNSKLVRWFGSWNSASDCFKPTIVVFPDDDGRTTGFDCAADDKEDEPLLAPPNSQVTSTASSCHPSRPASVPLNGIVSTGDVLRGDDMDETFPDVGQNLLQPPEQSLPVRNPEIQHKGRWNKHPVKTRHLSSLEETDTRFHGHRDSVTIAHARLIRSGHVSPKPLKGQDSYEIAKKRKHMRNQAASIESAYSPPKASSIEALDLVTNHDTAKESKSTLHRH